MYITFAKASSILNVRQHNLARCISLRFPEYWILSYVCHDHVYISGTYLAMIVRTHTFTPTVHTLQYVHLFLQGGWWWRNDNIYLTLASSSLPHSILIVTTLYKSCSHSSECVDIDDSAYDIVAQSCVHYCSLILTAVRPDDRLVRLGYRPV